MLDGSEIPQLCENLEKAEQELDRLSKDVPTAIKTQRFAVGTEKTLLARYVVEHIKAGAKPTLAVTLALADPRYTAERKTMMDLFELAEQTIQRHKQAGVSWETARSLLSMAKAAFPAAYNFTKQFPG